MSASNINQIESYLHCGLCVDEFKKGKHKGESPSSMQRISVGWTIAGLQVWCDIHDCNILHVDFEGAKHRADSTRQKTDKELT